MILTTFTETEERIRHETAINLLWAIARHRPGDPAIATALDEWTEKVRLEVGDIVAVTLPTGTTYTGEVTHHGAETVWGLGYWISVGAGRPLRFAPRRWVRPTVLDAACRAFDVLEEMNR